MVALLLAVALTSPFVTGRAEVVADSTEIAVGVVLDRGADVVVAHVIYAEGIAEVVSLRPTESGEWLGAFEPLVGAIPQVRFEAVFPGGESALSSTNSLVALGVPEGMLVASAPPVTEPEPARTPWIRLALAMLAGSAVLLAVVAVGRIRLTNDR